MAKDLGRSKGLLYVSLVQYRYTYSHIKRCQVSLNAVSCTPGIFLHAMIVIRFVCTLPRHIPWPCLIAPLFLRTVPSAYSKLVYMSNSCPFRLLLSTGSALISTPGPTRLASPLCVGKIYNEY